MNKEISEFKFWKHFFSKNWALTLYTYYVNNNEKWSVAYNDITKEYTKIHDNWWTITAVIHEDYYEWINDFSAIHNKYWKVWWDFEDTLYAESIEWFYNFYENFPPEDWDYGDI
jgi:hypothetical protein